MGVPRRTAAITPSHVPSSVASSVPVPTSSSVHGIASRSSAATVRRERWLTPRSNVTVSRA